MTAITIVMTTWAQTLTAREDIGMIRLGPAHPDLTGTVSWLGYEYGLLLDRHHFAFGHRPALYHRRMVEAYGQFQEAVSAVDCERDYSARFNAHVAGPGVLLALPYPWRHIGYAEVGEQSPTELDTMEA